MKTKRIKVERGMRVEICIRRSGTNFVLNAIGPCTVSLITSKDDKARPEGKKKTKVQI
jgi:hypothetical protein